MPYRVTIVQLYPLSTERLRTVSDASFITTETILVRELLKQDSDALLGQDFLVAVNETTLVYSDDLSFVDSVFTEELEGPGVNNMQYGAGENMLYGSEQMVYG